MTSAAHEKAKIKIVNVIKKSGIPIRAQNIAERVSLPDDVDLTQLLKELVAEGRIIEKPTLLVNGDVSQIYNVRSA